MMILMVMTLWSKFIFMAFFLPFIGCYTTGKKTAYHYIVQNELKGELFADGVSFQKNGRYNEAIEAYTRLLKDYPDESKAHYNLGMIYAYKVVNNKLALMYFDKFLSLDSENPKAADVAEIMCILQSSSPAAPAAEKSAGKIFAEWLSDKSAKSYHDSRFKCSKKIVLDINWNSGI